MKPQVPYSDPNISPYVASQIQHMAAQRMQHNAAANNYPERPDSFPAASEHMYRSSKMEGQWKWDRDSNKSNQIPSHLFNEGQDGSGARFFYQGQMPDRKLHSEKQENKESRVQTHEQDMEIGYEDNPSPLTFEGLEQKFVDEIMKLIKEQSDKEDAENVRHRERMIEINTKYQEKLASLRAQQASRREEFMDQESKARLHQYQQAGMIHYPNNTVHSDAQGYGGAAVVAAAEETRRAYAASQFESYRERPLYPDIGRAPSTEGRVPYPSGRVYNTGGRYYG